MENRKRKSVAIWLLIGVFMIVVQVLLGGITRLTGSGLSITEWKPIMGALPPLNEQQWNEAFDGYKQIAQYKFLNSDFSLDDFKFIFFWEWFHRLWARLLGVVFVVGFIYFLVRKYFDKGMVVPFLVLFALGGLQGLIGWIMVESGLNETDLYVNHIKLAIHFIAALVLLCYTLWFALHLLVPKEKTVSDNSLRSFTMILIAVLGFQLVYGAFMAGLKAAPYAPTFPLMNGVFVPDTIVDESWISNPFNVQFFHRILAYLILILGVFWFVSASKIARQNSNSLLKTARWYPVILIFVQVLLGIFTVLKAPKMATSRFGIYELLAEAHQLIAMFLLISLFVNLYLIRKATS